MDHYMGDKTPLPMNTPYPYEGQGGFSTIGSKSPAAGGFSPSFATPLREGPSFTPSHIYDVGLSPGPVQRTPIPTWDTAPEDKLQEELLLAIIHKTLT